MLHHFWEQTKWACNFIYSWEANYSGLLPLPVTCWLTYAALYKIEHKELENICAFVRVIRDRLISHFVNEKTRTHRDHRILLKTISISLQYNISWCLIFLVINKQLSTGKKENCIEISLIKTRVPHFPFPSLGKTTVSSLKWILPGLFACAYK